MEMLSYNQGEAADSVRRCGLKVSAGKSGRKMPCLARSTETQGDSPVQGKGRE
jgi:hypothetical protein